MHCPNCKKVSMEKKTRMMKEDGISFEAWHCPSCQEELLTMPQLKSLAKEYQKQRIIPTV